MILRKPFIALGLIMATMATNAQTITFYSQSTVRVTKNAPDMSQNIDLPLVVKTHCLEQKIPVKKEGNIATYTSAKLVVKVDEEKQTVSFYDKNGNLLMKEGEHSFTPITDGPDKGRYKVRQDFAIDANEPIYGIGMMQNGKMNLRGENRLMIQTNLEDFANVFQSIKGYGIYWDNYSPTQLTDSNALSLESQVGTKVDYYFMYGENADGVIREMRHLTGKVPMLPLWTYGFHQSRERYKSSKELLEVVDTYRKTGVPFDGIIQDWQYWGNNYLWNAMEFLNEDFANYKQMINHVHSANAHMSISIWASFGPNTKGYRSLAEKDLLYSFQTWPMSGLSAWPPNMDYPSGVRCYDPYSKVARDIYWDNLKRLHAAGIDAWWMDSTDPDHLYWPDSDLDEVKAITNPADGKDFMGSWRMVRNAFPLCTVEGVYEKQRASDDSKRVFILTRSYFAGQQRTGANTWSGDVSSSWDSFRKQVPICLNYTLTANPNVNTDIGGFFANAYNKTSQDNTATQNPLYQELYVRWMQFGAFTPMMRSHGTEVYREIYHYGKLGEPVYDALLAAIKLRYKLLPYIYSTSWQVSQNDDSFMRALMMDFKADTNVWDNNREYMFGRSILVAPIVNALYTPETANETNEMSGWNRDNKTLFQEGFKADWNAQKNYNVYLPKGASWYDYWTNTKHEGGQTVAADGTLAHCPLYVKAGSILPICNKEIQYSNIADWAEMDIVVYPGADASFTLYEDEGDNYNYEKGQYSTIDIKWNDKKQTLTIGKRNGQFNGMIGERKFNVRLNNGSVKTINYNGLAKTIKL
ncbi:MAG: glycoside hydrolase family 31 protein [Salinivirgaceae bacterium]|nr:glycoside hydrolase family 31 protein [Salinivirgaceae bacterium]